MKQAKDLQQDNKDPERCDFFNSDQSNSHILYEAIQHDNEWNLLGATLFSIILTDIFPNNEQGKKKGGWVGLIFIWCNSPHAIWL